MEASEQRRISAFQTMDRVLAFVFAGATAFLLVLTRPLPVEATLARILFTALLGWIAIQDFRTRRVSPALTMAWMLVGLLRMVVLRDPSFLPYWLGIFLLWSVHFYGGGDAKLLMGLFGLWPDLQLLWITSGVLIAVGLPILIVKYWRNPIRSLTGRLSQRVITGNLLPTDDELNAGLPFAFAYCLAGAIYLWMLT